MNALILLSHGSRRKESNQEMQALAGRIAGFDNSPFDVVVCCFQQFARPSFEEIFDDLVRKGVDGVVVFPLFLASGSHVLEDVPAMIAAARSRHPGVAVTVKPHLGRIDGFARFLMEQAG